jgi:DNA modification methylase
MILLQGDCRKILPTFPDQSVHCCVTSPPYFGLRDYGVDGQIGLESTPDTFVAELVAIFREVRRVLRDDGTLWLNLGDSYNASPGQRKTTDKIGVKQASNTGSNTIGSRSVAGIKPKDLIGIPWRVAFALQADGWWLRQDIIWSKPNPMPESITDRCTKAHEYIFLLSKNARYYFDQDAIKEESIYADPRSPTAAYPGKNDFREGRRPIRESIRRGGFNGKTNSIEGREAFRAITDFRNKRSVWEVTTQPFSEAHFATFPPALIEPCILAGCPKGGTVLDPFAGAGTTGMVADRLGRDSILIELNPKYAEMIERRIRNDAGMFANIQTEEIS